MNISSRFTESGMTGAFFWITQLLFLTIWKELPIPGSEAALKALTSPAWLDLLKHYESMFPETLRNTTGTLLTTFGIIGIFVTGIILDLLGGPYTLFENILLNRHMKNNQGWLEPLLSSCSNNIHESYQKLSDCYASTFAFTPGKALQRLRLLGECKRIQSFLFAYSHVYSSNATSDLLTDNLHLWRTSRAISTTLLILAIEILIVEGPGNLRNESITIYLLLTLLSLFLTGLSYNRMCYTLFNLACATRSRQQQDAKAT